MDLTVFGRQEDWEDSPAGWPRRGHATRTLGGAPEWPPLWEWPGGRPTSQWPRLETGYSDDLGAADAVPAPSGSLPLTELAVAEASPYAGTRCHHAGSFGLARAEKGQNWTLRRFGFSLVGEKKYTGRSWCAPSESQPHRVGILPEQTLTRTKHERVQHDR